MCNEELDRNIYKIKINIIKPMESKILNRLKKIVLLVKKYTINILKKIEFELFRNDGVYVKLTSEEKIIIKRLAKCQKKSTSDFIKWIIFNKYIDDFIK